MCDNIPYDKDLMVSCAKGQGTEVREEQRQIFNFELYSKPLFTVSVSSEGLQVDSRGKAPRKRKTLK